MLINHVQYGRGEDLIFLHGWGGNKTSLNSLAQSFASEFRITLVDFYGFGETPMPNFPLQLMDYVQSIVSIINKYSMENVTLVGHSFGGRVATLLAYKYPHLVNKIILIDSAGILPRRRLKYYYSLLRHKLLTRLNIKHTSGSKDYRELSNRDKITFKNIVNCDLSGFLPLITVQTLILWGRKDKDTPLYMARTLKRKLPRSKLVIFKNAGHFCFLDAYRDVVLAIRRFLSDDCKIL